ncbi:nuclear transcription factor Y subunit C-2 isoform X2 [Amborella trichopoda]|uniref:Core Histone H2A/H2B/H3 domain-containing protein n=1 Tax=Amborella trichopoda TaxID=13333 RepID=W1NEF6_AMBTC|nr:nuclear transcription factor Y subunit C-2 isoform X1 [Amborella trichopoda]XP_020532230.1 nuclear transcription factor Y subunit C-2 isoform X2 [Amborella trichopoda]ERM93786.1 hypothetical protein AMTR_s00004p00270830 [Amborella trichopoda]|eukprot:XP_020532226.1 nuclear transcription factor Y subunit C-2 isoform X1 [Amborella trichopoda]
MDQSGQQQQHQPQQPVMGVVSGAAQIAYAAPPYQPANMVGAPGAAPSPVGAAGQPPSFPTSPAQLMAQHQLACQHLQHHHQQQQAQQLQAFWANQIQEIEQTTDFKNHSLPLARIKKIMKADEDVRMISAEAPVIFAKACEMFILELTLRSWIHTEENKRRTLQKNDIAAAITRTDIFDFLVDIVPRDELKEEGGLGVGRAGLPGGPSDAMAPYYYVSPQQVPQVGGAPGMIVGKPVVDQAVAAALYGPRPPVAYVPWQQPQAPQQTQGQTQQQQMPDSG